MEMTMTMPTNYVEMTDDEMMYVEGGASAQSIVYGAVCAAVGAVIGRAVSQSFLGAMINAAAGWVANQINAAIVCAILNPPAAIGIAVVTVGTIAGVYFYGRSKKWW
ncbi:hypothetical protein [Pseudolactococcus laudensis]|uniref:hypothetical protein n=1 Tax=Pseudolactococcus laudensis TaxID=1494461 RepID=UPI0002774FB9|nr:hypothetical protein BN193_00820 [Lactococcus raffinolactis 4877]